MAGEWPQHGWRVRGDVQFPEKRKPGIQLRLAWIWKFIPTALRYVLWFMYMKLRKRPIFINNFSMVTAEHVYGVPLGGIGSGSIGRTFLGDFCRRQISPASIYKYGASFCDNFILSIQSSSPKEAKSPKTPLLNKENSQFRVTTLAGKRKKRTLSSWKCSVSPEDVEYAGLYPRSWIKYDLKEFDMVLTCRQISPIIPHDYKDSCLPVGVFVWDLEYTGTQEKIEGSFTFSWTSDSRCSQEKFESPSTCGLVFKAGKKTETSYAIGVKTVGGSSVSFLSHFDETGDGAGLWSSLQNKGVLPLGWGEDVGKKKGHGNGGAICLHFSVGSSNPKQKIEMAVSWDNSEVKFPLSDKAYNRRYTKWFNSSSDMVTHALNSFEDWEKKIEAWQAPVLQNSSLPDWYKSAIFNELYYFSDGGSVWLEADQEKKAALESLDPRKEYGRFLYLESHEYIMYNTIDVHFYSAAAFGSLWPKIELGIQLDVAEATVSEDDSLVWTNSAGCATRKHKYCVPHDVGCPGEDPWNKLNAYIAHDTAEWKDLNLKFVLESYRDYQTCFDGSEDPEQRKWFVDQVWPVCMEVMDKAESKWDKDRDGMIENDPYHPDQTYDMWTMDGPSAYCGILWVCSLYSSWKMAALVGDTEARQKFGKLLNKAVGVLDAKLWNGSYYRFDSSSGTHSEVIMSDQLCGLWSLLLGLGPDETTESIETVLSPVMNKERVASVLRSIFENNVKKSMNGQMGAVNGYSPVKKAIDQSAAQAEETWTGSSYALAATMLFYGMEEEGFSTAEGIYKTVYEKSGLAFQTPEALTADKYYRAVGYMRPLCIWSMQLALNRKVNKKITHN